MAAPRSAEGPWRVVVLVALVSAVMLFALAPLALPRSYSWLELGLSEAGAQGLAGAWVARTGFVVLGLAVLAVCALRHPAWHAPATVLHACFGTGMVMVAVFSHAPWQAGVPYVELEDTLHSAFASLVGFSFLAGVAATLAVRRPRTLPRTVADVAALVVTGSIPLFLAAPVWGLLQRLMFLTAITWYAAEVSLPGPVARERLEAV